MQDPRVIRFLKEMRPGAHTVLVYDSPENKRQVLFNHPRCGVADAKLAYVCSEENPQEVRCGMRSYGIDVDELEGKEILSVGNYDEVYIKNDRVEVNEIISHFSDLAWNCASQD